MAYTEREIEELNRAAAEFAKLYGDVRSEQPPLEIRQMQGKTVHLYERVEAYISKIRPRNKHEERKNGHRYRAAVDTWNQLKDDALKRAAEDSDD